MTTIAYKKNMIATDSRMTAGGIIINDMFEKAIFRDGVLFFLSGYVHDFDKFLDEYFKEAGSYAGNISAITVKKGVLIYACAADKEEGGIWKSSMDRSVHTALGSGSSFAIAAMDHGATAIEAIEYAMTRDVFTGGKVFHYEV